MSVKAESARIIFRHPQTALLALVVLTGLQPHDIKASVSQIMGAANKPLGRNGRVGRDESRTRIVRKSKASHVPDQYVVDSLRKFSISKWHIASTSNDFAWDQARRADLRPANVDRAIGAVAKILTDYNSTRRRLRLIASIWDPACWHRGRLLSLGTRDENAAEQ
jgi:hypothetical protein